MTVELTTPINYYTVSGIGPYAIGWPYTADSVQAFVKTAGVYTELVVTTDFSVDPLSSTTTGNLWLTAAAAALHAGSIIVIARKTLAEQGWQGLMGEREKGLEAQLDRSTMIAQESNSWAARALRTTAIMPLMDWAEGTVPILIGGRPMSGPSATEIAYANAVGATTGGYWIESQVTIEGDTTFAYEAGPGKVVVASGAIIQSRKEQFSYLVLDAAAVTYHRITAGGVKLNVLPVSEGEDYDIQVADAWGIPQTGDASPVIAALFAAADHIVFGAGTYRMDSVIEKLGSDISVDFGVAQFLSNVAGHLFNFGLTSDTPIYTNVAVYGGVFGQYDTATIENRNFIRFAGISNHSATGQTMDQPSNGGIVVEAGCEDGVIENPISTGQTGYGTIRAVWLQGSTASDYAAELVDTTSVTRNATPVPVFGAKRTKIRNPKITVNGYGIYAMNAPDTTIINPDIDIGASGLRCVAFNNYSPRSKILGGKLRSSATAVGVLVTQFSTDCKIDGTEFLGTFGGVADVHVQMLAEVTVTNCTFDTESVKQIKSDMGGFAHVKGNEFSNPAGYAAGYGVLGASTLDPDTAGTGTIGNTATMLPGVIFEGNIVRDRLAVVSVTAQASASGNIAGLDLVISRNNILMDFDHATLGSEYAMVIDSAATVNKTLYQNYDNVVLPSANAARNTTVVTGAGQVNIREDIQQASIYFDVPAGLATAQVGVKGWGGNLYADLTRSVSTLVVSPRTLGGGAGAGLAPIVQVTPVAGFDNYRMSASGSNYILTFFNGATQVDLATAGVIFMLILVGGAT